MFISTDHATNAKETLFVCCSGIEKVLETENLNNYTVLHT